MGGGLRPCCSIMHLRPYIRHSFVSLMIQRTASDQHHEHISPPLTHPILFLIPPPPAPLLPLLWTSSSSSALHPHSSSSFTPLPPAVFFLPTPHPLPLLVPRPSPPSPSSILLLHLFPSLRSRAKQRWNWAQSIFPLLTLDEIEQLASNCFPLASPCPRPTERRTIAIGRWGAETLSRWLADASAAVTSVERGGAPDENGQPGGLTGEIFGRATDRSLVVGCHRGISDWSAPHSNGLRTHVYKMNDGCSCFHRRHQRQQHHQPTYASNDIPYIYVIVNYIRRYVYIYMELARTMPFISYGILYNRIHNFLVVLSLEVYIGLMYSTQKVTLKYNFIVYYYCSCLLYII